MTNYRLETKPAFTITGYGRTVQYGEGADKFGQIVRQKQELWTTLAQDGRLTKLEQAAHDDRIFAVNEAVNQEMWYYAGVIADQTVADATRNIDFPAGTYLVIPGQAATAGELFGNLEGQAFGQVLPSLTDYAYVGGPNTGVQLTATADQVSGEMWIPVQAR